MTSIFKQQLYSQLRALLASVKRVAIISHVNPDGDAVGSMLALMHFLKANYSIDCVTILPNRYPDFLKWMTGTDTILLYKENSEQVKKELSSVDAVFCLDFNNLSRIEGLGKEVEALTVPKILIDHHLEPSPDFDMVFSHVPASSTSELIYRIAVELKGQKAIPLVAAEAIYVGIMTDTGCFAHSSSNPELFNIVAGLLELGIHKDDIYSAVYNNYSADRVRFMGYSISEKMVILPEYKAAYIALSREELQKYNFQPGDTEGFVNIPLSITGIELSAILIEAPEQNQIRISLRSRGDFSVNEMSRAHFNGGGHKNAAGGKLFTSLHEAVNLFLASLKKYKDELQAS